MTDGLFTVELDYTEVPFEAALKYYLEVRVRRGNETGGYTQLLPRQKITAVPYALSARSVQKQCPAGYLRTNSLCVQQVDSSPYTFSACAARCVGLNAHICTSPEVRAALTAVVPVTGGWSLDWIGDQTADDEALYVNNGGDPSNPDGARSTGTASYCRCCISIE